jgi:hypothetical protein
MALEIRKMDLRFSDGEPYLYHDDILVAAPNVFGYVYNQGPPHDHNRDWKNGMYLEDLHPSFFDDVDRKISVVVLVLCPTHIGKDCTCKVGLEVMPRTYDGKIILDLYDLVDNDGNNECFFQ